MDFDKKKIQRKIRRDEALEMSNISNLKQIKFRNKKVYNRKKKHQNETD